LRKRWKKCPKVCNSSLGCKIKNGAVRTQDPSLLCAHEGLRAGGCASVHFQPDFFLSALRVVLCNTLRHGAPLAAASAETLRLQASISVGLDRVIAWHHQAILTSARCRSRALSTPSVVAVTARLGSSFCYSFPLVSLSRECAWHQGSSSQLSAQACIHCPAQTSLPRKHAWQVRWVAEYQ
jgi:hypothetical protein